MICNLTVAYVVCRHLEDPLAITRLFQKCRGELHISFRSFKECLKFMQRCGLVEVYLLPVVNPCGHGLMTFQSGRQKRFARHAWQLTEKGKLFMAEFERLCLLVESGPCQVSSLQEAAQVCT